MTIAKLAVNLLVATVLASSAVAEQRKGRVTTCRGVFTNTPGSEDTYSIGHCRVYNDSPVGQAVARGCKGGKQCTVRARMDYDMITHVYSVVPH